MWIPKPELCIAWPQHWALTRGPVLYACQQGCRYAQGCMMALALPCLEHEAATR